MILSFKRGSIGSEDSAPIDLGTKKRIAVRMYKGNILIDIREMYQQDGEEKPGRKGIALNRQQYNTIKVRITLKNISALKFLFLEQCG